MEAIQPTEETKLPRILFKGWWGSTYSGAPGFAIAFCTQGVEAVARLDLGNWGGFGSSESPDLDGTLMRTWDFAWLNGYILRSAKSGEDLRRNF